MREKIGQAKEMQAFLVDWGMSEGDAKRTALRIIFKLEDVPDCNGKQIVSDICPLIKLTNQICDSILHDS